MSRRRAEKRERRSRACTATQVIEDDTRRSQERAWVLAPVCGGACEGPEFEALVMTCFDPNDGSAQGILNFIEACNELGMDADQVSKASWVRHDHLTHKAREEEKRRHDKCGSSALETFGPFNPNPEHEERVRHETR